MDFFVKNIEVSKLKTQCAIVFAHGTSLLKSAAEVDKLHSGIISQTIKNKDLGDKPANTQWITVPPTKKGQPYERVLVVQLGQENSSKKPSLSAEQWVKVANGLATQVTSSPAKDASIFLDDLSVDDNTEQLGKILATALLKASYRYTTTKNSVQTVALNKVTAIYSNNAALKKALQAGKSIGLGVNTARELGNLPGNICTPSYLAQQAKDLATEHSKLTTKILSEKQMEKLGMHSLLSVSRGSDEEAQLIIMTYKNGKASEAPHVLVGKGITFDTGGISLKPGAAMDEMKFDMCGAASVFGTVKALISMDAKVNVTCIVAAAENMPSGRATKPGDVVTSMSGQTIEILNTDAEGRLVLCDALTYAERFKPKSVVDVATLTGACVIALGSHATGLYSNDEALAQTLLSAGKRAQDKAWHMPLWDEYQKQLDSNFADIANIGGREAGSVTAACFLSRFTQKYAWAHLDIAGTAWQSGSKKGASGRPVSMLVEYLTNS